MNYTEFPRNPQLPDPTAYSSLTAYVDDKEKSILETKFQQLNQSEAFYFQLAKKINEGKWETLFKEDPAQFPLQALQCVRMLTLSSMAFATSQLMFNVIRHQEKIQRPFEIVPVYIEKDGKIYRSERAVSIINATMKVYFGALRSAFKHIPKTEDRVWTKQQEDRFYVILSKMNPCEQRFIVLRRSKEHFQNGKPCITPNIVMLLGFNQFNTFLVNQKLRWMVPSCGMMDAYQQACYPDSYTIPVYRLTLSSERGLHETLKAGGRDLVQSFEPLKHLFPSTIDSADPELGRGGERIHDNYHQNAIARIPLLHRELYLHLTDILYDLLETEPNYAGICEKVIVNGIELEHIFYCEQTWNKEFRDCFDNIKGFPWLTSKDPNLIFWRTFMDLVGAAARSEQKKMQEENKSVSEIFAYMDRFLKKLTEKIAKHSLANDARLRELTKTLFALITPARRELWEQNNMLLIERFIEHFQYAYNKQNGKIIIYI